jgi:hypothetical protein
VLRRLDSGKEARRERLDAATRLHYGDADLVEVRGRFALNHPDVAHF